jgi:hypothetical protein
MKKEIVFKPKTMQDIRDERDSIHNKNYYHADPIMNVLFQCYWDSFSKFLKERQIIEAKPEYIYDSLEDEDMSWYQNYTSQGYSFLGITTIALTFKPSVPLSRTASFKSKKKYISELLVFGFKTTNKDKYLSLLTKYEEFGPSIIKKKLLLPDILPVLETEALQEITKNILLLMFEMEESLL